MRCPHCGSAVEPQRDARGGPLCPVCNNTGTTAVAVPAPSPVPSATGPPKPTSGKAITALVLGISCFVLWPLAIIAGPVAIVFGVKALKETAGPAAQGGRGMAITGIVLGAVGLVIGITVALAAVVFVLVSNLGEASDPAAILFSEDPVGVGGLLTVEEYDGFGDWSDFEVSGTADCQLPFGDIDVGDEVECFADGSVRIRYTPTGETAYSTTV